MPAKPNLEASNRRESDVWPRRRSPCHLPAMDLNGRSGPGGMLFVIVCAIITGIAVLAVVKKSKRMESHPRSH